MTLKRLQYIGLLAILASLWVVAVWFAASGSQAPLPSYDGKTVKEWFYGEYGHPGREKTIEAARVAFTRAALSCSLVCKGSFHRSYSPLAAGNFCWLSSPADV